VLGVYDIDSGSIQYLGNKICKPTSIVKNKRYKPPKTEKFLKDLSSDEHYFHLHNIDNSIFFATVEYFKKLDADWCNLPLTTKMISSPGEVYAGKQLDYTTDALPVTLDWFDKGGIFLSESSQFYLELRLIIEGTEKVFSIYNSFRKEPADFSHLSEFQHIEFEGRVDFDENTRIYTGLLKHITNHLLKKNLQDMQYYLTADEINKLSTTFDKENIETITFKEAMNILEKRFNSKKYKKLTLENFGSFEEIALTRTLGKHCNVVEFPIEEIPFYHDSSFEDKDGRLFAKNSDFILLGYREVVGSGQRITDKDVIMAKAKHFNLPEADYLPYVDLRSQDGYQTTCGFGLGWQRYTQWLLKMPYIWNVSHIPRGDWAPTP